jgi:hypothetical protein
MPNAPKDQGFTPEDAARRIEPGTPPRKLDQGDDPREELGYDDPESSAQKLPEPPSEPE